MSERTIEIPSFIDFLQHATNPSLIDVGSYNTGFYAKHVVEHVTSYIGVDPLGQGDEDLYVDRIYKARLQDIPARAANVVSCISVLEHLEKDEQTALLSRIARIALNDVFLSFPFGIGEAPHCIPLYRGSLGSIQTIFSQFNLKFNFYHCADNPNAIHQIWLKVPEDEAAKVELDASVGVQCVCIVKGHKK